MLESTSGHEHAKRHRIAAVVAAAARPDVGHLVESRRIQKAVRDDTITGGTVLVEHRRNEWANLVGLLVSCVPGRTVDPSLAGAGPLSGGTYENAAHFGCTGSRRHIAVSVVEGSSGREAVEVDRRRSWAVERPE